MSVKEKPTITSCKSKPYTKITYYPDFEKFNQKYNLQEKKSSDSKTKSDN